MSLDPMIHSLRWVRTYPFLARAEAEIWRDDFDPVAKWVKRGGPTPEYGIDWTIRLLRYEKEESADV